MDPFPIIYTLPFIAAFLLSYYTVSNIERFRNLFFLLSFSRNVLLYCCCYGLLGTLLFVLLKDAMQVEPPENNTIISPSYLYALGTGIATKGIAELNLFNLNIGTSTVPVGVKTFTSVLDKYFESRIESSCFRLYSGFLKPYRDKYSVIPVSDMKKKIAEDLKDHPNRSKVGAFLAGEAFTQAADPGEIMGIVLREFGDKTFKQLFHSR